LLFDFCSFGIDSSSILPAIPFKSTSTIIQSFLSSCTTLLSVQIQTMLHHHLTTVRTQCPNLFPSHLNLNPAYCNQQPKLPQIKQNYLCPLPISQQTCSNKTQMQLIL
jgi:hypothetical protein